MKQAISRLLIRLGLFAMAIAMGAVAVMQAQRGLQNGPSSESAPALESNVLSSRTMPTSTATFAPIPAPEVPSDHNATSIYGTADLTYAEAVPDPSTLRPPVPPLGDKYTSATPTPLPDHPPSPMSHSVTAQPVPPLEYELPPIEPSQPARYDENPALESSPSRPPVRVAQAEVPEMQELPRSVEPPVNQEPQVEMGPPGPLPEMDLPPAPQTPTPSPRRRGSTRGSSDEPIRSMTDSELQPSDPAEPIPPHPGFPSEPAFADPGFQGDATLNMPDSPAQGGGGLLTASRAPERFGRDGDRTDQEIVGTGQPGPDELEGLQTPSLSVRKSAPSEVQVGKPAKLRIVIRNVGKIAAHDVVIRDEVPRGTRLIDTQPAAALSPDGALLWQIGTVEPNQEVSVTQNVMPLEEGEIGSVATVTFQVAATASSLVTQPQLTLEHSGPQRVLVGQDVIFNIRLSNSGTGIATGVRLEEDVPEGLRHYDGRQIEYPVGTLKPGEARILELKLVAEKPGMVRNVLFARADSKISVQDEWQLEVVAPDLQVAIDGPRKRYLDRKASYEITIANPGTAEARNVEILARLPQGMKFLSANNSGQYDASRHLVTWRLESLPAQEMGTVELVVLPNQMGRFPIRVDAKAAMGLSDSMMHDVEVEGIAALLFTVTDVNDPIEVGGETTYEVHVVNQGSKTATNLRLAALIPAGMQPVRGDGPARVTIQGQKVLFDPLPRLAPQGDTMYRIYVKGTHPGDKRVQVQMVSDDIPQPVLKEESTHVYSDE